MLKKPKSLMKVPSRANQLSAQHDQRRQQRLPGRASAEPVRLVLELPATVVEAAPRVSHCCQHERQHGGGRGTASAVAAPQRGTRVMSRS
jgi:hypothetical protein